jgi:hypothetical protein
MRSCSAAIDCGSIETSTKASYAELIVYNVWEIIRHDISPFTNASHWPIGASIGQSLNQRASVKTLEKCERGARTFGIYKIFIDRRGSNTQFLGLEKDPLRMLPLT